MRQHARHIGAQYAQPATPSTSPLIAGQQEQEALTKNLTKLINPDLLAGGVPVGALVGQVP